MTDTQKQPVRKQVQLADLDPLIRETLAVGGAFRMTITGTSNLPTLTGGRDQVTLVQVNGRLRKYDLPLYIRDNGQYILHRIVSEQKNGTYTCCGDHQWKRERGIRPDQIIGYVSEICRNGKQFSVQNRAYRIWVRVWVFLLPCRGFLIRVYHASGSIKRFLRK